MPGMADLTRRQFLRGNFFGRKAPSRPPWALAEKDFLAACTRCCYCISACPQSILTLDRDNFPTLDFSRGQCTFCEKCVDACGPQALVIREGVAPWTLKAEIQSHCITRRNEVCRACGEACPLQAIRFRPVIMGAAQPEVIEDICNGCGACFAPCPVQAIRIV